MKSNRSELEQRYLLLFKIDALNLFNRIYDRRHDYVEAFSLKRNRGVFKDIFESRFQKASIRDMSYCTTEVIEALNQFYTNADKIYWYLKHTQDMPNTIEDEIYRKVTKLKRDYEMLALYIDAELSGTNESEHQMQSSEEILGDTGESFQMEGEAFEASAFEDYIQPESFPDFDEISDDDDADDNNMDTNK